VELSVGTAVGLAVGSAVRVAVAVGVTMGIGKLLPLLQLEAMIARPPTSSSVPSTEVRRRRDGGSNARLRSSSSPPSQGNGGLPELCKIFPRLRTIDPTIVPLTAVQPLSAKVALPAGGMFMGGEKVRVVCGAEGAVETCGGPLPTVAVRVRAEKIEGELTSTRTELMVSGPLVVFSTVKLPAPALSPGSARVWTGLKVAVAPGKAATSLAISGEPHPVTRS
jgi:hypothetical protein